jgi:putative ABC transport system permease protein
VKERTREIGTRRALGATQSDIFFQVLVETAALTVTGSLLGVALSWPASHLICESVGLPFVFEWSIAAFALAAAITLNLAFSVLPSRKAASLSPLEALRYE